MLALAVCSMLTLTSKAAPPAWRALQTVPSELIGLGKLRESPPCLATLPKVGSGRHAAWTLGAYRRGELELDVRLQLDRNPDEPCCKLLFCGRGGRIGHMLLACGKDSSSLRGMHISEEMRGRGLSKRLLAIWLAMCLNAGLSPTTRVINKPLLSLSLSGFGFTPLEANAFTRVEVAACRNPARQAARRRLRGLDASSRLSQLRDDAERRRGGRGREAYVRTAFCPPVDSAALEATVGRVLGADFVLDASAEELRRALTLRGRPPEDETAGAAGHGNTRYVSCRES